MAASKPLAARLEGGTSRFGHLGETVQARVTPKVLLGCGIALRMAVFCALGPYNNDQHAQVVQYIVDHGSLPASAELGQSYHPPLYYLLAAPILYLSGSFKAVQGLSLLLSIGSLLVLYRLIFGTGVLRDNRAKWFGFALVCCLPQFVTNSLYISNDTLTVFLGCLSLLQAHRFIAAPDWKNVLLLAVLLGLGLSTKFTFLAFTPVLLVLVLFVTWRAPLRRGAAISMVLAFALVAGVLGSYKFVDNVRRYHDPFINNLDHGDWTEQSRSYRGLSSYLDFNLLRLLASPTIEAAPPGWSDDTGSYPLLLYGTFWYQHLPESNFGGNRNAPYKYLGSLIYLAALAPSFAILLGMGLLSLRIPPLLVRFDPGKEQDRTMLFAFAAMAVCIASFGLLLVSIHKYHVWSIMQARLLFPSIAGLLAAYGVGSASILRHPVGARWLTASEVVLLALLLMYSASEIGWQALRELAAIQAGR